MEILKQLIYVCNFMNIAMLLINSYIHGQIILEWYSDCILDLCKNYQIRIFNDIIINIKKFL